MAKPSSAIYPIYRAVRHLSSPKIQFIPTTRILCSQFCTDKNAGATGPEQTKDVFGMHSSSGHMEQKYYPSKFDKLLLIRTKKFASVDDIPEYISPSVMDSARSKLRIFLNVSTILLMVVGCFLIVRIGKKESKKGVSVHQMNLDWHKQEFDKKRGD